KHAALLHVAEDLLNADGGLARPAEADGVLCVDGVGQLLRAVVGAGAGLRNQRPHLAARDGEAAGERRLSPELALPQGIAVGLIAVRRRSGTEEVTLKIAGQLELAGVSDEEPAEAALAAGEVEFADVALAGAGERDGIERGVDVGVD